MYNILIIYYAKKYPLRAVVRDHLNSFRKYLPHKCFYLNVAVCHVPWYIKKIKFDLIIFDWLFLDTRLISRETFQRNIEKVRALKHIKAVKIALPQDEFINTDLLCDFINDLGVNIVFSVAPESQWPIIYSGIDVEKVTFYRVLTGYINEEILQKISKLTKLHPDRTIDIGYRAHTYSWLGRQGLLKRQIGEIFNEKAPSKCLKCDILLGWGNFFSGDDWFNFLLGCKYTLGVEGGASIIDRDGTIAKKVREYVAKNPGANFEEIEAACFKGLDGGIFLVALSPRHLDACITRTCQVLIEGEYNGILQPGKHYIELKRDFSNIDQIIDIIKKDNLREKITDSAFEDIVLSGEYTYKKFVEYIIDKSFLNVVIKVNYSKFSFKFTKVFYLISNFVDLINTGVLMMLGRIRVFLKKIIPKKILNNRQRKWEA